MSQSFDNEYYYYDGIERHGPLSLAEIKAMISSHSLKADSHLAVAGGEWKSAASLFPDAFATATPGTMQSPAKDVAPAASSGVCQSSMRAALAEMVAVRADVTNVQIAVAIKHVLATARNWILLFMVAFFGSMILRYVADKLLNSHQ